MLPGDIPWQHSSFWTLMFVIDLQGFKPASCHIGTDGRFGGVFEVFGGGQMPLGGER
jgi:hypothetical protein